MRIKRTVNAIKKRRKILKLAKGYRGSKSVLYRAAREQVMKSGQYAYVGRRLRKRDFRKLWIARINAAARTNGLAYSRFMDGLNKAGVELNRKMLSEISIADPVRFTELCETAKSALDR
jgi:large subunit ribosomal protein L20